MITSFVRLKISLNMCMYNDIYLAFGNLKWLMFKWSLLH